MSNESNGTWFTRWIDRLHGWLDHGATVANDQLRQIGQTIRREPRRAS